MVQTKPIAEQITPLVQRQEEEQEKEPEKEPLQMQRQSAGAIRPLPGLGSRLQSLQGGEPLPVSTRAFFEPRFGADFSHVRVHRDSGAAETARQINAQAFTRGRDIVFGPGRYQPQTPDGQRLLAHELTHVVQQNPSGSEAVLFRQKSPAPRTKRPASGKAEAKAAGTIKYLAHGSFVKKGLSKVNLGRAIQYLNATDVSKTLLAWLRSHSITVRVYFVAESKDMPTSGKAAGYYQEVGPKEFNVYVVAGLKLTRYERVSERSIEEKEYIETRESQDISDTLFHELLHAWFLSAFPTEERKYIPTGHTAEVEPAVVEFGIKTYDEEEYDSRFLKKLKQFDAELRDALFQEKERARQKRR